MQGSIISYFYDLYSLNILNFKSTNKILIFDMTLNNLNF